MNYINDFKLRKDKNGIILSMLLQHGVHPWRGNSIMLLNTCYEPGGGWCMRASSIHPTALFGMLFLFYRWENKLGNCNIFQVLLTVQKRNPIQTTGLQSLFLQRCSKEHNPILHTLFPTLQFEDSRWFSGFQSSPPSSLTLSPVLPPPYLS